MADKLNLADIRFDASQLDLSDTPVAPVAVTEITTIPPVDVPAPVATVAPDPVTELPFPAPDAGASEETTIIGELTTLLGYEIDGDFADDYEGLAAYTKAVGEKIAAQFLDEEEEQFPDIAEYREFRRNGGRPEDFFQSGEETDFKTLTITDTNISLQKQVVTMLLTNQGYSPEEAQETVNAYEDANQLLKQASIAKNILAKNQESSQATRLADQSRQAAADAAANRAEWTTVQSIIVKGDLNGVVIPESDKNAFFDWMSKPVDKQGNSQRTIDRQTLSKEQMLMSDYLFYKKYDIAKLAANVKTTRQTLDLKARLKPVTAISRTAGGSSGERRATPLPSLKELIN